MISPSRPHRSGCAPVPRSRRHLAKPSLEFDSRPARSGAATVSCDAVAFDLDSDLLVGFDAERTLGGVDDASGGAEQDQVRRPPSTESGRHRETTTHRVAEQCKGSFDVLAEQLGSLGEVHLDAAAVAMPWHVEHDELVIAPELVAEVAPRGGSLSEAVAEHEARATADDRASKGGHRP